METVTHHGRTTTYDVVGPESGPGLCLVHGSGSARTVWSSQRQLSTKVRVASVDLSGHGDSDDVDADPGWGTISAYASDVIAVAEETNCDLIVGCSLGGAVALHIELYRRFHPQGLVLVGTGARMPVLDDLLVWLQEDFEQAVEFLHGPGRLFRNPDDQRVEQSKRIMYTCGRAVTERDFRSCHMFDIRSELGAVTVPCLAIVGAADRLTPPSYHADLAEHIPDADWLEIEDAAHLVMLEQPTQFNDALERFIARIDD